MTNFSVFRFMRAAIPSLVLLALLSMPAVAQTVKVEGLIKARNGDTIILHTSDSPKLVACSLTALGQMEGVFKARRKEMSMAALIPGLAVNVEGACNDQNQLEAKSVFFKGNDLKQAESIQAGLHESREVSAPFDSRRA